MKFMDENASSFSPSYSQSQSPKIHINRPTGSGLTLVIPSLKSLKAQKSIKDPQPRSSSIGPVFQDVDNQEKRIPRPVKLKPLKEVLTKLISQIKKKDDYAFFLHPVDVANVPGYADVVKRPMDLGTMTDKVNKGKYRSLEEFASDLKLVTTNAKTFNPPGSIYHTEADRLEIWALDHISKASSTVIQYETDWTIEIEKDDEGPPVNVEDDEEYPMGTPMDVDGTGASLRERSVSSQPQPGPSSSRRGPRGPYKKNVPNAGLSETLEPEGGLPGSKDGLGSFPPGSDWAKTMVALKRKGKRYKTKKERLRIEREGPPLLADGSLDYTEMEDPFSVLSYFVPDPPSRPHLVPLYPPLYNPPIDPSSSQNNVPPPTIPSATALPLHHAPPDLPLLQTPIATEKQQGRRRHWTIMRNATWRQKGKEREDEQQLDGGAADIAPWRMPRPAQATDFGSFALLQGELAEEMRRRGMVSSGNEPETRDDEAHMALIRERLNCETNASKLPPQATPNVDPAQVSGAELIAKSYWTSQRAAEAEEYVRDLVYGGVKGLAYVRSLAEFVDGDCYYKKDPTLNQEDGGKSYSETSSGLGMPLAKWVEMNIVDPLTEGRHSLLRDVARELARQQHTKHQFTMTDPRKGTVESQVDASLHLYPNALIALSALLHIRLHKIDMGSLIKVPTELFLSEEEWIGKSLKEKRKSQLIAKLQAEVTGTGAGSAVGTGAGDSTSTGGNTGATTNEPPTPAPIPAGLDPTALKERLSGRLSTYEQEGPAELNEVLEHVANLIVELDRRTREQKSRGGQQMLASANGHSVSTGPDVVGDGDAQREESESESESESEGHAMKVEEQAAPSLAADQPPSASTTSATTSTTATGAAEDPALRNLRLNLLALAKRAPLDTIARLPKDLVPEHIRHFVPTLGSTG